MPVVRRGLSVPGTAQQREHFAPDPGPVSSATPRTDADHSAQPTEGLDSRDPLQAAIWKRSVAIQRMLLIDQVQNHAPSRDRSSTWVSGRRRHGAPRARLAGRVSAGKARLPAFARVPPRCALRLRGPRLRRPPSRARPLLGRHPAVGVVLAWCQAPLLEDVCP